jgi:hypothetical protein
MSTTTTTMSMQYTSEGQNKTGNRVVDIATSSGIPSGNNLHRADTEISVG